MLQTSRSVFTQFVVIGATLTAFSSGVWADDDDVPEQESGRGVARISVINGDVSIHRGDSGDFISAALNAPLVVQDQLVTGPDGRAEVQFDWANMIRLSHDAEVRMAELEYKRYLLQVGRGTVTFRVLRDHDAEVEVSTLSVSVKPTKKGTYRITVLEDGTSEVTVRSGEAEIFTPKGSERLREGRTLIARGGSSDPEYRLVSGIRTDEWDDWNRQRDGELERSNSYNYVSHDIYGADDLDDHGRWVTVPSYGNVWSPAVAAGWAPYRNGRWSWIDYYGWNWVSSDPWGWAPYHYGRWFYSAPYGWCWWPGAIRARHSWSPGLVAFFGFGGRSGVGGLGFGNVGWIPLAPREPYYPWYGRGWYRGYRTGAHFNDSLRIVNNINVTNVYRNAGIDSAMTGLDRDGFGRGRSGNSLRLHGLDFSRVNLMQGQLPITPGRESLRLADRDTIVRPRERRDGGRFYSRRQPGAVERVPFEDQRRGMEQFARRAFPSELPVQVPAAAQSGSDGWRRFGSPRFDSSPNVPETRGIERGDRFGQPSVGGANTEWRRFGGGRISGDREGDTNPAQRGWRSSDYRGIDRSNLQPRTDRTDNSVSAGRSWRRDAAPRTDPVRISPPIVRERGSDRSWGGGQRSAPPTTIAPRGGGGSGPRSSGGMRSGGESRGGSGRGR